MKPEPSTAGHALTAELRRHLSVGVRTSRYRRPRPGKAVRDLHHDMIELIMITAQHPGVYTQQMEAALRPGFGAALAYDKHVAGFRIDGTLHRHISELTPWRFAALLGQMVDAGVTNTGEGERFFAGYHRQILESTR